MLDVEGQRLEEQTAGVVQLFRENCSLCDHHPTTQHRRLNGTSTQNNNNVLINNVC